MLAAAKASLPTADASRLVWINSGTWSPGLPPTTSKKYSRLVNAWEVTPPVGTAACDINRAKGAACTEPVAPPATLHAEGFCIGKGLSPSHRAFPAAGGRMTSPHATADQSHVSTANKINGYGFSFIVSKPQLR